MVETETTLHLIGRLLVAFLFLGTLATNATMKFEQHRARMEAYGIPMPKLALIVGFAMQGVGGLMIAFDWHRQIGAWICIVFIGRRRRRSSIAGGPSPTTRCGGTSTSRSCS